MDYGLPSLSREQHVVYHGHLEIDDSLLELHSRHSCIDLTTIAVSHMRLSLVGSRAARWPFRCRRVTNVRQIFLESYTYR